MIARLALRALLLPVALIVAVAGWFAAGLIGALWTAPGEAPGDDVEIRLIASAIHYDVLLPATPETRAAFAFAAEAGVPVNDPWAEWLLVGWGAREFYTATGSYSDMSAVPIWAAVTGDASVLRVDAVGPLSGAGTRSVFLSDAQYGRLIAAMAASREGGVLVDAGFTLTDRFFEGRGGFHPLRTCNVWIGEMMRAAGLRFGRWTPTPQAVRLALRRMEAD